MAYNSTGLAFGLLNKSWLGKPILARLTQHEKEMGYQLQKSLENQGLIFFPLLFNMFPVLFLSEAPFKAAM